MTGSGLGTCESGVPARKRGLRAREIPLYFCIHRLQAREIPDIFCIYRLVAREIPNTFCIHRLLSREIQDTFCIYRLVSDEIPDMFCIYRRLFFKKPFVFYENGLQFRGNKAVFRAGGRHFCRPASRMGIFGTQSRRIPVVPEPPGFRLAGDAGQGKDSQFEQAGPDTEITPY